MPDHDQNDWLASYFEGLKDQSRKRLAGEADLLARFTDMAASKGVVLGADSFEYIQTLGIVAKAPGIARKLLGPIAAERDGLLPFNEIVRRLPDSHLDGGCFVGPDFILMAHPCFRRNMSLMNNWAPQFIDLFWALDGPGIEKYIALDEDRVRIDVDGMGYVEADTWFGAPFNEDIGDIKPGIVKLRPPLDLDTDAVSMIFTDAYCLDVKWSESDGIKTFQALEVKSERTQIEVDGQRYFPARYLHAEYDLNAGCFRHFDGAIQLFTEDEYFQRRDSDFNMTMKNPAHIKARSTKVFKINGPLKAAEWVEFCCQFFAKNPLSFEYFCGDYPKSVTEAIERMRAYTS